VPGIVVGHRDYHPVPGMVQLKVGDRVRLILAFWCGFGL
jgi:hypothetical protein